MRARHTALALCGAALMTLAGCGGGSSDSNPGNPSADTTPGSPGASSTVPNASTLTGVAATGSALARAGVVITDASAGAACQEAPLTTLQDGRYTCTLKAGETAPFFIVVTDSASGASPLVSVATRTPAAGQSLTVNTTPLTTAIVGQLADGDALAVVKSGKLDPDALQQVTARVLEQLRPALAAVHAPSDFNPFNSVLQAATASAAGNEADQLLDIVKVVTDPASGRPALATVDQPTPVALATATLGGKALGALGEKVTTLPRAALSTAQAFTACFALPTSQRVLAARADTPATQGGPEVTDMAPACRELVARTDNAAGIAFLHNGYSAGQWLYNIMTSDTMTGATFSVPEIMAFYPADPSATAGSVEAHDRAVLNIKYRDANGQPGNLIAEAARLEEPPPGGHPTPWWLVGNHQPVDVVAKTTIRRVEQLDPRQPNASPRSGFQTGIQFLVNARGPGSIEPTSGTLLRYARISGPGLPGNGADGTGLVYTISTGSQDTMDLVSKSGSLTSGASCGNNLLTNCPNFWVARTRGLTGADAFTLIANPASLLWIQPSDGSDPSRIVKGARYKVELFYGTRTTPSFTYFKTLLTDLMPASQVGRQSWNALGPLSLAALDPQGSLAGEQPALTVDWNQDPAAQQISSVAAIANSITGGFGPAKSVPKGARSVVLDNVVVPAFSALNPPSRGLLLGYRMTDASTKTAGYYYD